MAKPGIDITEIPHFSLRTIGGEKGNVLRTKGAETKFLLGYVLEALHTRGQHVPNCNTLIEAGRCLIEFDNVVGRYPRRVNHAQVQAMLQLTKRFVALGESAHMPQTPKLHTWLHMVLRTHEQHIFFVPSCIFSAFSYTKSRNTNHRQEPSPRQPTVRGDVE